MQNVGITANCLLKKSLNSSYIHKYTVILLIIMVLKNNYLHTCILILGQWLTASLLEEVILIIIIVRWIKLSRFWHNGQGQYQYWIINHSSPSFL